MRRRESGFTLLELIATVALGLALTSIGVKLMRDARREAMTAEIVTVVGRLANAARDAYAARPNGYENILLSEVVEASRATGLQVQGTGLDETLTLHGVNLQMRPSNMRRNTNFSAGFVRYAATTGASFQITLQPTNPTSCNALVRAFYKTAESVRVSGPSAGDMVLPTGPNAEAFGIWSRISICKWRPTYVTLVFI